MKFLKLMLKTLILGTHAEVVLTSTHNLCFGGKIRKIDIPLHTTVLLFKIGVQGGILYVDMFSFTRMCFRDDLN